MKLRTMAMVTLGVGALAGAGCSKKPKEQKAPDTTMGTAAGTGATAGTGAGTAAAPEAKLEGKALADRYVECMGMANEKKWDDFRTKCLADDFKAHQADGPSTEGGDAAIAWFKDQTAAFPDMKLEPQLVLVDGRDILGVFLMTGTQSGPLKSPMGELPATNKKVGQLAFHRLKINDENRAAEEWIYMDPATLMSQLGVMPKEAPKLRAAMEKGLEGAPVIVVAEDSETEKANLDIVKKSNEAFAGKKFADFAALYADDAFESDQAGEQDTKGKKGIQAGAEFFVKAFPDLKLETKETFAAGDYVAAIGSFSGTNTGAMGPMKPTKKSVTGQYAEVFKIKDGKITEVWRFRNGMAMAMQLGLLPAAAAGGAAPAGGSAAAPAEPKKEN